MNQKMAELADFKNKDNILDMGCGIAGSSIYLSEKYNVQCTGINLNLKQCEIAKKRIEEKGLSNQIQIINTNYLKSGLESANYDGIWALETICHCDEKRDFIKEANRLLKPGGVMVLSEYFARKEEYNQSKPIRKWLDRWAIPGIDTISDFRAKLEEEGFEILYEEQINKAIYKSSLYMYLASFPGFITTEINQLIKDYGEYSRNHYKSAYWQYIALKKGLWDYHMIKVRKK